MTLLFADTETTGLVNGKQDHRHPSQPHLVQLGLLLTTDDGGELGSVNLIVRPDGYVIPDQAAKVHGITTDIALSAGVPLVVAVALFTNLRARADLIVAHNQAFDRLVMDAAIHRTGRQPASPGPEWWCTMEAASPVVAIPPTTRMVAAGFTKFKPPNLGECVRFFFDEELTGAHDAMVDVRACARVYFALKSRAAAAVSEEPAA